MKNRKNIVIVIIGIAISLFFCFNTKVFATTGTVTTSDLRLRKEENTTSEILTLLNENDKVEIISENGDWYKVKANEKEGFVSKQYIKIKEDNTDNTTPNEINNTTENKDNEDNNSEKDKPAENAPAEQTSVQNENVNTTAVNKIEEGTVNSESQIRIMPLINGDVINTAKSGEKYKIVSNAGLWSYIKNNEKSGWILKEKLSIQEEAPKSTENNKEEKNQEEKKQEEKNEEENKEENKKSEGTEKIYSNSKTYYVKGTSVNARSKANKSSSVEKQLDTNEKVKVTGEDGDWYIVDLDGKKAYILKTLLSSKKVEVTSRTSTSLDENKETKQNNNNEPEKAPADNPPSSSSGEAVVAYAKQFLGYPYVYGTNGPKTFDCSGFVQYVYKHFGISLSRSSKTQANDGVAVSKSNLQPGDIIIFKNTARTEIGHVGIYIGNNQFIHASNSKTGVIISSLSTSSYQQRYVTARRVL